MRIGVVGAGGRVGRRVAELALARGDEVVALVRRPLPLPGAEVRVGDAGRPEDWRALLADVDGVVSAVGGGGPGPRDTIARVARALAAVGQGARVVWVGTLGLMPLADGRLRGDVAMPPALRDGFLDHRAALVALQGSAVAWTVLCPGHMPLGPAGAWRTFDVATLDSPGPIPVDAVAEAALSALVDPGAVGRRWGIAREA